MSFLIFVGLLITYYGLLVPSVLAQCPVCIVTVGGGMLIAKKLGIDDLLVSTWIAALNMAISFWLAPKLKYKFFKNGHILGLFFLATTLVYFQFTDQIGNSANQFLGIDKILFGQILGTLIMALANHTYISVKKKLGHTPFPYAKVVFPLGAILLITIAFKLLFRL